LVINLNKTEFLGILMTDCEKFIKTQIQQGEAVLGAMYNGDDVFFFNLSTKTFNFALLMRFSQLIFIKKCDFFRIVIFVSQTDNRNTKELFFL
jgi:dUTPase